eukprot:s689_g19.t2
MGEDEPRVYGLLRATGIVYQLEEPETTIGRSEDCSIPLEGRGVSKLHARLTFTGKEPQLVDLGSCNGTFVNGVRLRANSPVTLNHGDMVRIGLVKWTFSFELPRTDRRTERTPKRPKIEAVEDRKEREKGKVRHSDEAKPPDAYGGPGPCYSPCTPAYGGPGVPGVPGVPAMPGVPGACGVNVLPVPFPVMQPMPPMYPPQPPPPQTPPEKRELEAREREDRRQDSEWKHELLQKLWQLEANIARLADANQEICQAIRRSESGKLEAPPDVRESPDIYEEEISKAVTALTSAAERLSINAEIILDKEDQVEDKQWIIGEDLPLVSQIPTDSPEKAVEDAPQAPNLSPKFLSDELSPEDLSPEDLNALIIETQRNLSLYAMVVAPSGVEDENASVSSLPSSASYYKHLMFEGAIGETSPVLTAILASLETLEKLGLNHPEVGGHRRWHALAQELERLREEEQMESQRLERIELEERNFIQDTEAELMQLRARNNERGDETSSLLKDLSRMEAQKDRLQAELWKLSQQLRDQKAQYQEDKLRAQAALHFHSQKEEVADQLEEERNSGRVQRMASLARCVSCNWSGARAEQQPQPLPAALKMEENGFALDAYCVPKCGKDGPVPGGTMPKASNEAGSLFTEVKKNAKYPGPDYYKKEGKPFGQKAPLGQFSRIARDDPNAKKNWPAVGQYETITPLCTPRTRGGIMAKSTRGCLIYDQAKLLECILHELQLKDFNFGQAKASQVTRQVAQVMPRVTPPPSIEVVAAGPDGHRRASESREVQDHLLTPEPETWSETPSPSAASGTETWWTQSTSASVESSPLLQPKQLCLDAETWRTTLGSAVIVSDCFRMFQNLYCDCSDCLHLFAKGPKRMDKIQLPLAELLPTPALPATLVTWRVMNPNAKFKASCGFPLVSHQLSNHLLEDFRVIFAAGNTWASQNKGKKQQASSKAASKFGSLQLKFLGDEAVGDLQLYFHLGAYKLGPFRTFPERSVSELCELPVDWRRLVEKADMSLTIGVEVAVMEGKWKPAPGKYDPQKPEAHVDCLAISPDKEQSGKNKKAIQLGPGYYSPNFGVMEKRQPAFQVPRQEARAAFISKDKEHPPQSHPGELFRFGFC